MIHKALAAATRRYILFFLLRIWVIWVKHGRKTGDSTVTSQKQFKTKLIYHLLVESFMDIIRLSWTKSVNKVHKRGFPFVQLGIFSSFLETLGSILKR